MAPPPIRPVADTEAVQPTPAADLETDTTNTTQVPAEIVETAGTVGTYVHTNGKIAVLVELEGGDAELGRDIAMHVAATNPLVVSPDDAPAEVLEKEREIYTAQAAESGKPAEIIEKMVSGRVRKYLAEISLTEQPFVKDGDQKVSALLKGAGATVKRFIRYEVGDGIEVEEVDFAAEVQAQLGND